MVTPFMALVVTYKGNEGGSSPLNSLQHPILLDHHIVKQQVMRESLVLRTLETLRDLLLRGGGDQREIQLVLQAADLPNLPSCI
jgi:hypothetical protein